MHKTMKHDNKVSYAQIEEARALMIMYATKTIESEKTIERKLVEKMKACGGLCIKLLTYQFIGLPDRMCLFPNGKVVFVELKTTGEKPKKIQLSVHNKLRALGFRVEVIDTTEGVMNLVNEVVNLPF